MDPKPPVFWVEGSPTGFEVGLNPEKARNHPPPHLPEIALGVMGAPGLFGLNQEWTDMPGPRQRFKMMTLVLLVALTGCGKGVFERPAVFPNPAEQVSVCHGSIHASGRDFTVLPDSTVINIGLTQVIEDSGASAGTAVAGFFTVDSGSGTIMATTSQGCPASTRSQSDLALALDEAARPGSITVSDLTDGQTLAPGVYELTYSVEISSGDLTLDVLVEADAAAMLQTGSLLTVTLGLR